MRAHISTKYQQKLSLERKQVDKAKKKNTESLRSSLHKMLIQIRNFLNTFVIKLT